jgi:hypothetical protein
MDNRPQLRIPRKQIEIDTVRATFGNDWHIFRTDEYWCAMRRGGAVLMLDDGPSSLIQFCLYASRLDDLARQLCLQEFLRRLSPGELARVHATGEIPDDLFTPGLPIAD